MGKRKERKERADKLRNSFINEMAQAIIDALDGGKPLEEAWKIGAEKERELKLRYPDKKQMVTQAAAAFISEYRRNFHEKMKGVENGKN